MLELAQTKEARNIEKKRNAALLGEVERLTIVSRQYIYFKHRLSLFRL